MSICEYCHGAGKIKTIKLISAEQGFDCVEEVCTKCNGSGEHEQTNEEWFCGLSTEEKAEWLLNTFDLCGAGCSNCFVQKFCFLGNDKTLKEMFVEWLKEKHNDD